MFAPSDSYALAHALAGPEIITDEDRQIFRLFAYKNISSTVTEKDYARLAFLFPDMTIPSYKVVKRHVQRHSGFDPVPYDCCIKSCCCFVGPHADKTRCPYCNASRFDENGKPRRRFQYLPIIPRLLSYYKSAEMVEKMQYRAEHDRQREQKRDDDSIDDVMDGTHYKTLQRSRVVINGKVQQHKFFDASTDIALGLSTDGFAPFRRRSKTC
ncbi:hypothetical protein EV714DRAFT_218600, partial [Schizophyllum commune]